MFAIVMSFAIVIASFALACIIVGTRKKDPNDPS